MTDTTERAELLAKAAAWLRECSVWLLTNDLDMQCPMTTDPLDLADDIEALSAAPRDKEAIAFVDAITRALANYFTDATLIKRHERGIRDKGPMREAEAKEWNELRALFDVRGAMPVRNARGVIRKKLAALSPPAIAPEDDEYMSVSLSRDGTVTSHNAFDADFDEMVRATETIVRELTRRLSDRKYCPYSHGGTLKHEAIAPEGFPDIGGAHPLQMDREERAKRDDRLRAAFSVQQKGIPDQTALVWRTDLIDWWHELVRSRARLEARPASAAPEGFVAVPRDRLMRLRDRLKFDDGGLAISRSGAAHEIDALLAAAETAPPVSDGQRFHRLLIKVLYAFDEARVKEIGLDLSADHAVREIAEMRRKALSPVSEGKS